MLILAEYVFKSLRTDNKQAVLILLLLLHRNKKRISLFSF